MLRLDYLSCCLTVFSTTLLARKNWTGLILASINSIVVCVIGVRTSQFGFIPANLFCIAVYALSLKSWMKTPERLAAATPVEHSLAENQ